MHYESGRSTERMLFSALTRGIIISRPQVSQRSLKSIPTRRTVKRSPPQGCFFFEDYDISCPDIHRHKLPSCFYCIRERANYKVQNSGRRAYTWIYRVKNGSAYRRRRKKGGSTMPQGGYLPEGSLLNTPQNRAYTQNPALLQRAMEDGRILEATAGTLRRGAQPDRRAGGRGRHHSARRGGRGNRVGPHARNRHFVARGQAGLLSGHGNAGRAVHSVAPPGAGAVHGVVYADAVSRRRHPRPRHPPRGVWRFCRHRLRQRLTHRN